MWESENQSVRSRQPLILKLLLLSFATCAYNAQFLEIFTMSSNRINKLSESQLNADHSRKRIGRYQSSG